MKHRKTLLLGLCLCALGTQAQTVTVVLNDGTSTKWPADQIKEIYFATSEESSEVFTDIHIEPYSNGNFVVELKNDTYTVQLNTYRPSDMPYIATGVYTVGAVEGLYIDAGIGYTFVTTNSDSTKTGIAGGTMTVSNESQIYTFNIDLTLADGNTLKGTYVGEIDALGEPGNEALELTNIVYHKIRDMVDGEVYIKFNDADWSIEGAIDFFCNPGDTTLAEGTYKFSDSNEPFTFSPKSYVDFYRIPPYGTNRFSDGTIVVEKVGEDYNIEMSLTLENGTQANYVYSGPISGKSSK